ncbi:hypothetical protein E0494_05300 [Marinilabiliaceae bacterium JC040]|nr:hypothetical protein [Marinilabiliaceae bacterium JC040]
MEVLTEIKDLSDSTNLIYCIENIDEAKIISPSSMDDIGIRLYKKNNHFLFKIENNLYNLNKWNYNNVKVKCGDLILQIPNLSVTNNHFDNTGYITKGKITNFKSGNFIINELKYNRLLLPITESLNFLFSIENVLHNYKYKKEKISRLATKIFMDGLEFLLYQAQVDVKKITAYDYLIIECKSKISYLKFSEYCFSILISFGYISGNFINDDGYYFQYKDKFKTQIDCFEYAKLRGSINCSCVPIYTNTFSYIQKSEISDLYKDKVRSLSIKEFSKLCTLCHNNDDIKSVLLLLIEVNTQSLVASPGILSIALETIAKFINDENTNSLAPIKSKPVSKSLRKDLLAVINDYEGKIEKEGIDIIKRKIDQLNQRTNRDKLLIPFQILGIEISDNDKEAIEQRNAFLHGRNPMVQNSLPKTINEEDKYRYYLHLKLYVLISAVLLKYIGYDNLVVNYPKIYEEYTGIKLDEEYYRQI